MHIAAKAAKTSRALGGFDDEKVRGSKIGSENEEGAKVPKKRSNRGSTGVEAAEDDAACGDREKRSPKLNPPAWDEHEDENKRTSEH